MYDTAKKSRAANKAKAERLANRPIERVDSSDWTPPALLNADVKTGMRPVSKQALKRGGKVHGSTPKARADRMARKAGGRVETKGEQPLVDRYVNRDLKKANEYRDGEKHEGALKRGGRAHKDDGGAMGSFKDTKTGKQITPAEVATSGFRDKSGNIPLPPRRDESGVDSDKTAMKKGGAAKEKWIQKAIKKPGALHKQLGVAEGKKIPAKKLEAASEKGGKLGKRARLAKTLRAMHKDGGKVHSDAAEDKAMIKSMVKPSALRDAKCGGGRMKKADGGPTDPRLNIVKPKAMEFGSNTVTPGLKKGGRAAKQFGGPLTGAMPAGMGTGVAPTMPTLPPQAAAAASNALANARPFRAAGGRTKGKGKTNINIVIAQAPKDQADQAPMGMPAGAPPMPPKGVPVQVPPAAAGGMPPMGAMPPQMPPMPPAGAPPMPPMARKAGGRITKVAHSYKDMEAGAGSGEGRLQKTDIAKRAPHKAGGKVYRSYKDMDAGAGSGEGRLEKTEIEARKSRKG